MCLFIHFMEAAAFQRRIQNQSFFTKEIGNDCFFKVIGIELESIDDLQHACSCLDLLPAAKTGIDDVELHAGRMLMYRLVGEHHGNSRCQ